MNGMEWLADPQLWLSFLTLTALEIVLGVDNLIFIAILSDRLPLAQRARARRFGLALALVSRLMLLSMLFVISRLTAPLVTVLGHAFSWRDLILLGGGLFLLYKATHEIHQMTAGEHTDPASGGASGLGTVSFVGVITQIAIVDIVFSLDSVITAVGMADNLNVMVAAVIAAVLVMLIAATPLANFVSRHPTVKMLALAFLFMVGLALIADGWGLHIPKGYLYAAMAFSAAVESLNLIVGKKRRSIAGH
jgi:predicted tellurium resistance membrane protein TerC